MNPSKIEEFVQQFKLIPITERMPERGQRVIVLDSNGKFHQQVLFSNGETGNEQQWISWPNDIEDVVAWIPERVAA